MTMDQYHDVGNENKDPLEKARETLQLSGKSLQTSIQLAQSQVAYLRLVQARHEKHFMAASDRLRTVTTITSRLCDECFSLLPVLGKSFDDLSTLCYSDSAQCCYSCGHALIQTTLNIIELPPPGKAWDLSAALHAREFAERVIEGRNVMHGIPPICSWVGSGVDPGVGAGVGPGVGSGVAPAVDSGVGVGSGVAPGVHSGIGPGLVGATTVNIFDFQSPFRSQKSVTKAEFVALAMNYQKKAAINLARAEDALRQWENYRSEREEELGKINRSVRTVKDTQKKILKKKLRELGGSTANSVCSTKHDCPICLERPKEIVFQCGHQSCRNCSPRLITCHTCRMHIAQRIKLYH
jgi:hypothetical protein